MNCCMLACLLILSTFSVCAEYKKIAVVVTSYNNADWYTINLESIFSQEYPNYRLIYIDDCSPDGTGHLVQDYINNHSHSVPTTLICHPEWKSALANLYLGIHLTQDDEIIVNIDGDDWFSHTKALADINQAYSSPDVWWTWGHSISSLCNDVHYWSDRIPGGVCETNSYRDFHQDACNVGIWSWWHPRTFYSWLGKLIKLEDCLHKSSFKTLHHSPDSAIMYPIAEMAGHHHKAIEKIAYVWNVKNPLSHHSAFHSELWDTNRFIGTFEKYQPLAHVCQSPCIRYQNRSCDVLLFCSNIHQTQSCISTLTGCKGIRRVYLVDAEKFHQLEQLPFEIHYAQSSSLFDRSSDFTEHLFLMSDQYRCSDSINFEQGIVELERTFAFGFYFKADENLQPHAAYNNNHIAWQFRDQEKATWRRKIQLSGALYRTSDIKRFLRYISVYKDISLACAHANRELPIDKKIGISLKCSKIR